MYIKCGKIRVSLNTIFIVFFLSYTLLSFNSLTYGKRCISIALYLSLGIGILTLISNVCQKKINPLKFPGFILLLFFLLSNIWSIVWNGSIENLKENIIKLIFQIFFFFLLYYQYENTSKEYKEKEFLLVSALTNIYLLIGGLASLWLMWSGYSKVTTIPGGWSIGIGFVWGRLWGIYSEPNYITIVSVICILYNLYNLSISNKYRLFRIFNILVQFLFICFTDSRTGAVTLGLSLGIYYFNIQNYKNIKLGKIKTRLFITLFITALISVGGFFLPRITVSGYNHVIKEIRVAQEQAAPLKQPASTQTTPAKTNTAAPIVNRGYDLSEDISNRRFAIWKSGIDIFLTAPFTGTSYANILDYTKEKELDIYIVNNDFREFSTMHNEVVNILVSQGIGGIVILVFLIFVILLRIFPGFYQHPPAEMQKRNFLFTSLVSVICGAMFLTGMFYSNSPSTVLFWYYLGYLMFLTRENRDDRCCMLDTVPNYKYNQL